jgi:hypothetical protein
VRGESWESGWMGRERERGVEEGNVFLTPHDPFCNG